MTTSVLQNARIVDPSRAMDEIGTIIIRNGKILASGKDALNQGVPEAAIVRDCRNLVAAPGLIDARVFTGEPRDDRFRWSRRRRRRCYVLYHDAGHRSRHRRYRAGRIRPQECS
jgi:imidazolonepropionase-like amidohydrolase